MKRTASISIDTAVLRAVQEWAEAEQQPFSSLVEHIVENAVRRGSRRRPASVSRPVRSGSPSPAPAASAREGGLR